MAASPSTATELTQEQVVKTLVKPLEDKFVFLAAGPRIFDTAGPLRLPKGGAPLDASLTWVGENELIPEAEVTFDELRLQPDPTADGVFRLFGAPVIVTSRIPDTTGTGNAVLADFSQIAVARDMAPSVKILTETYAQYDQQAIRVVARYDTAPMNEDAVVKLTGITRA